MTHTATHLASASIETFVRSVHALTEPDGQCFVDWTSPAGQELQLEVFRFQRMDGFSRGDILDVTTQGRAQRTLSLPVYSRTQRVEVTLDPEDSITLVVGDDNWEYVVIIRGARAVEA